MKVRVRYDAHLPALSLQYGENWRYILAGKVFQTLHGSVLCKNWHLCRVHWEDCKLKIPYTPTPPEVATTVAGLIKVVWEEWHACLHYSSGRTSSPRKPYSDLALTHLGK